MIQWSNWSGSIRFTPQAIAYPTNEAELGALIKAAWANQQRVRVVGAGHSSSPLVETPELLISLKDFHGVESHDPALHEAVVRPSTTIKDLGVALCEIGLATHNTGDVDVQTIAGAIATGTHGTGRQLKNLSSMLIGMRIITGTGELATYTIEDHPEIIHAAQVSLGALGIMTALRLRLVPRFQLQRREWCTTLDAALQHFDELRSTYRNVDMYWYPRSDEAKLRIMHPLEAGVIELPYATLVHESHGWSADVLPRKRTLKFDEMEYAIPAEAGMACFQAIRQRVKTVHRRHVGWRILYRTVAADDAWLSPAYRRETVTISLHHNAGLPFWQYFSDIEPLFQAYGGRPHWGKKHTLTAEDLQDLYPQWAQFQTLRQQFDPDGLFLNQHLQTLLFGKETS